MTTPLGLKTDVPLMLLPVRLETHFLQLDTGTQLLVRIYPDDVHADSHEPRLTANEIAWGQHFWTQTWLAGSNEPAMRAAWRQLAEQFGAPRAAYIADVLTPTNTRIDAQTKPSFPTLQPRPDEWPQPPKTRVLPDAWIAIGYVGGQRFTYTGAPVINPLALGPTLDTKAGGIDAENMSKDPNAAWLVDFEAAVRAGMALRIPYPAAYGTPLDRLFVIGVKAALTKDQGQQLLENVLRAHRYVEGLAFVPQGAPTNNTDEAASAFTSLQDGYVAGPLAAITPATKPFKDGDGSNGDMSARAFGVDAKAFTGLDQSTAPEQRDAYHMNVAAWRATWGYFLEQMMSGTDAPSDAAIREGREHFSSYVRARGPLPVLRIGAQPYGVLPAMSFLEWKNRENGLIDAPVVRAVSALRDVWRRSLPAVPRIPGRSDTAGELVKILAMLPASIGFAARPTQPLAAIDATTAGDARIGSAAARDLAASIGVTWVPRQRRTLYAQYQRLFAISNVLVQGPAPEALSDTLKLDPNYMTTLLGAKWNDVRLETITPRADVLLYLLLRHAALQEYATAAFRVLLGRNLVTADARREADTAEKQTRTPWALLGMSVAGLTPTAIGDYLDAVKATFQGELGARDVAVAGFIWRRGLYDVAASATVPTDLTDALREFAAFERSVKYLSDRPTAVLGRLVPEAIDLASHRLDAWATSFATKRLETLRRTTPKGIAIGGYGYVEDVVAIARAKASKPIIPPGETAPELADNLYDSVGNYGYVQAPSLGHATTAAILRSGYISRKTSGDGNIMAVNLSSERVRTALYLLEGVRQGQSLSALLGYRFERGLHENHPDVLLDQYIPSFRALAPLPGDLPTTTQSQGAVESLSARNVVDGLALLKRYRAGRVMVPASWTSATIPFGAIVPPITTVVLPPADPNDTRFVAIDAELRALDDALDAISDVTVAEAVHQMAQGNAVRAGAALEAIALGEAPAPELHVLDTPRSGIGLVHRVMVLFSGVPAGTWTSTTPRSQAEPFLSAWASQLLGPVAADALCRVVYINPETGAAKVDGKGNPRQKDVSLRALGLGPLDIVYLPEGGRDAQASELEQRIALYALQPAPLGDRPDGLLEPVGVRLSFARQPDWSAGTLSVGEVLEAARIARRLVTSARALGPSDLALPDANVPDSAEADVAPANEPVTSSERPLRLTFRADMVVGTFVTASQTLVTAVDGAGKTMLAADTARTLLIGVAAYGVPGAFPIVPSGTDATAQATLHTQAQSVASELRTRLARIDAIEKAYKTAAATATPSAADTRSYHLARLREVFGEEFRVLPRFTAFDAATLGTSFGASTTLQDTDSLAVVKWLQRATRIRDGASRLASALMYADALGGPGMSLKVGQLPYSGDKERWVGLARTPLGGRLSLVAHAPAPIDTTRPLAGLLVDEWVEVVPNAVETTGLAFHFNRPNARAPQAILLAVPPDDRLTWDVEILEATVSETLELAKLRTVDLSALGEIGQYLPALYFADPSSAHTITTDVGRFAI